MYYSITHKTIYTYNQGVFLKPHFLRLRPRCDSWQRLHSFSVVVEPQPMGKSEAIDLDGNSIIQLWFTNSTESLHLEVNSEVETFQSNPFNYLLESWALQLPIDYPSSLLTLLSPYLKSYSVTPDVVAMQLAQEIYQEVNGETVSFLFALNNYIYKSFKYLIRETGEPWFAGVTWNSKEGSCRDLAVLFMETCRAIGLASRFVSGYQEGDPDQEELELHAWVEVYLPGAGWRGYDPTHGLVVSDRHIPLAASAIPSYTTPVLGSVTPVTSILETGIAPQSNMSASIIKRVNS